MTSNREQDTFNVKVERSLWRTNSWASAEGEERIPPILWQALSWLLAAWCDPRHSLERAGTGRCETEAEESFASSLGVVGGPKDKGNVVALQLFQTW